MMTAIVVKETRALLRDGRLWTLGAALLLLFAAMLLGAHQRQQRGEQERREVETASRAQWDHQGDRNPHRGAHFGLYAFKPTAPLAALEPGVDAQAGQAIWLEPHRRNLAMFAPAADAPPSIGLGELTPAFVLLALVPLLIVVLGHGAVAQERESGTLRMLHASGLRARPLLLGKWIGLCLGLVLVLSPALLLGAWLLVDARGIARAFALLLALAGYYGVWAALALLVSLHARTSRAALLVLTALWVAAVFVVPRLGATGVERLAPLPTGQAFWSAITRDIDQGLPGDGDARQRMQAFDAALLTEYRVARLEDLPFGVNAKRRLFRDDYATRVYALHFDALWEAQARQQSLLRGLTAASPFVSMRAIGASLAGTDLAHRRHFEDAAEHYRRHFTTLMDEWDLRATRGITSFESRYAGDAVWQAVPRWTYEPPGFVEALRASWPDLALQALWLLLAMVALLRGARRLTP